MPHTTCFLCGSEANLSDELDPEGLTVVTCPICGWYRLTPQDWTPDERQSLAAYVRHENSLGRRRSPTVTEANSPAPDSAGRAHSSKDGRCRPLAACLCERDMLSTTMADILKILIEQRDRVERAIAIVQGTAPRRGRPPGSKTKKAATSKKRRISAAARKAAAERMRAYWAERKRAQRKAAKKS